MRTVFQARLNAPPAPPLEASATFLRNFFADDSWEEARVRLTKRASFNTRAILAGLAGIESLLASPPAEQGVLWNLVWWEANEGLDDPTDEGATVWLREVAEMAREVLGDKPPPRREAGGDRNAAPNNSGI